MNVKMPFPLGPRDMVMRLQTAQNEDEASLVFFSPNNVNADFEARNVKRIQLDSCVMKLAKEKNSKVRFQLIVFVNVKGAPRKAIKSGLSSNLSLFLNRCAIWLQSDSRHMEAMKLTRGVKSSSRISHDSSTATKSKSKSSASDQGSDDAVGVERKRSSRGSRIALSGEKRNSAN
jgi:hypothetical protein